MRSLALAQYLRDQGRHVHLVTTRPGAPGVDEWRKEGRVIAVPDPIGGDEDARGVLAIAGFLDVEWVVVDGDAFGSQFPRSLRAAGLKLMLLDDGGGRLVADAVVNPNLGAEQRCRYETLPGCTRLLGVRYALLRRSLRLQAPAAEAARPPRLLITFGGDDRAERGRQAVQRLAALPPEVAVTLVWSGPSEGLASVQASAPSHVRVLAATDLAPLMAEADLALSAGGTTALELAFLGVPAVLLPIADNQRPGAAALAEADCALVARDLASAVVTALELARDPRRLQSMSARGRALVDGDGVTRVGALLLD